MFPLPKPLKLGLSQSPLKGTFLYPGFAPFIMDLRYIYIVFGQTLKLAKLGRTCEAYNGNGERLDMSIDLTECVKCVDRGGDCVLDQLKPPNDQTGRYSW